MTTGVSFTFRNRITIAFGGPSLIYWETPRSAFHIARSTTPRTPGEPLVWTERVDRRRAYGRAFGLEWSRG